MIFIILLLFSVPLFSQKRLVKKPIVRDSIVEIIYTDGTHRKMVWINDSTVMLVLSSKNGKVSSRAYIDPEFAENQRRIYYFIKIED